MNCITLLPGHDKNGTPEQFEPILFFPGEITAVVGNTGSGKTRLIRDIEQLSDGSSPSGRQVLLDGKCIPPSDKIRLSRTLISHLTQNMRFVLDTSVEEFLNLHKRARRSTADIRKIMDLAGEITPEPFSLSASLPSLSGGQTRALMIADIAVLCDSPIILIDEIENAGIDKKKAFSILCSQKKAIIIVTHDPHTALMAERRIILQNGGIQKILKRSRQEYSLYCQLDRLFQNETALQTMLRSGKELHE